MSASTLMIAATLLFATMGVCVKMASTYYGMGEVVMARGVIGTVVVCLLARAQRTTLRTPVPWMHFWRSVVGVAALVMWFYAIAGLPLATAITLNYMSSVWMALFMIGSAIAFGAARVDGRLVAVILLGFLGVAMVLRPTMAQDQIGAGLTGLASGVVAAIAYLQVAALARAGEPELRTVFYFSVGSAVAGLGVAWVEGFHQHTWRGAALLVATGVLATMAQVLMTRAYSIGRPLVNASLQYLGIVFSAIFGVWLFDDHLPWLAIGGMILIVVAGVTATRLQVQTAPSYAVQPPTTQ